jgi:glycerophosphoryl diester phosphodiesterase
MKTIVWAHRGSSFLAPENTLEAFELAAEQKADGIELDIHLTADGQLAVIHDETLERTTNGTGFVESHTMTELKKLDANILHPEYQGAKIPTLPEVLDFVKGNSLRLNIEIKEEHEPNPELTKQLAKLILDFGLKDRTMYCSFNHYSLLGLRRFLPDACIGLLYHGGLVNPWDYAKAIGADCLHPYYRFGLLDNHVEQAHKAGLKMNVWTVNEPDDIRWVYEQGADGIITNKPNLALELRKND